MHQLAFFSRLLSPLSFILFLLFFKSKLANDLLNDSAKTCSTKYGLPSTDTCTTFIFFRNFSRNRRRQVVNTGIHIILLEDAIFFTMRQNECRFRGRENSSTFPFHSDNALHSRLKYFKHETTVSECTLRLETNIIRIRLWNYISIIYLKLRVLCHFVNQGNLNWTRNKCDEPWTTSFYIIYSNIINIIWNY